MAKNMSAFAKERILSHSTLKDATGSDPNPIPLKSQTHEDKETAPQDHGTSPALTEGVDLSQERSLGGVCAPTSGSQHTHRKRSNDSLYAVSDDGSSCAIDKKAMATVPTTEELVQRGGQGNYCIVHYHGVALDPSITAPTRDASSVMQTPDLPLTHRSSGTSLPPDLESFKGSEGRHGHEVQATYMSCGTASRSRISRTSSTDQDTDTEDRPILPPRPSALVIRRSQHTSQAQASSDEAEPLPSQYNGSRYSRALGEHISLSNTEVQTVAAEQSIRPSETTQLHRLVPRNQHSSTLIDLNLQNRLWQAVQQDRLSDARFLLGKGAIPDLICGDPTSRNLAQTPLCRAASDNSFELMALLLHYNADPNIVVPGSLPAFRYACWAYVQNPRSSLDGITMLVDHGARVDAIEIAVFLRMVEEVYPPGPKEFALPARIFGALDFILKKSSPPEEWVHMALDACSERPRLDVIRWLKQSVKFTPSDRAVGCVTRIIALPRSWQFRRMGLEIVLEMGVTETDVFQAVDLIEASANTHIITAEQRDDLSKLLWDARDKTSASQAENARLPQTQHEEYFGKLIAGPDRDAYRKIPFSKSHDQTSAQQSSFPRYSAIDQYSSSVALPALHSEPAIDVGRQRSKRRGLSFFSAKNKNRA